jgi:large subunit ribosomal protein L6
MSRLARNPIKIESGVEVKINNGSISVKGSKGTLNAEVPSEVKVTIAEGKVAFSPANENEKNTREVKSKLGLIYALVRNMQEGVTKGYSKTLEIEGVGYKAASSGKSLKLNLGFSHDVEYPVPEGIEIKTPKPTEINISGIDKRLVGQVAAEIRGMKKPEPYKGKGIRYTGEYIRRKEGKKK